MSSKELMDCRRYARAVISSSFISSLRHVQTLKSFDESLETVLQKLSQPKPSDIFMSSSTRSTSSGIKVIKSHENVPKEPTQPKIWSPIKDGKMAINVLINQIWKIPYAPCQYVIQFICTVSLYQLQRHKYCVRWQNGRRSAEFYVNIDQTKWETLVWCSFPGEMKPQREHTASINFQRFLQRNLF